jgi:hypothetical protein
MNGKLNAVIPSTDYDGSKKSENVEYCKYFGSMITNDARGTHEIEFKVAIAKAAFKKEKNIFSRKLELNVREKLVTC